MENIPTSGPKDRPGFMSAPVPGQSPVSGSQPKQDLDGPAMAAASLMRSTGQDDEAFELDDNEELYWAAVMDDAQDEEFSRPPAQPEPDSRKPEPPATPDVPNFAAEVREVLRLVVAGQHSVAVGDAARFFRRIKAATNVLDRLDGNDRTTWPALLEALEIECSNRHSGTLNLEYVPLVEAYDQDVCDELAHIVGLLPHRSGTALPEAESTWFALVEKVQRHAAAETATRYLSALRSKSAVEKLVGLHRKVEPPTTRRESGSRRVLPTARIVLEQARAAKAATPPMRLSFGLPTLDHALTGQGEPVGAIGLGEQMVIAGPTGTGKTSMFYTILAALVQDMVNQGKRDGKVIALHTEETSEDKLRGAGFAEGQRHHHLIDNLIIENIGSSRRRIAEIIYDTLIDAVARAQASGRPIADFAPHAFLLDYIQEVAEPGEDETTATLNTAKLVKNGVQELDPEELAKYSGVDFATYAGMPWPEGLRDHRIAVVTFAQLRKLETDSLYFKAGNRRLALSDFALEDGRPGLADHAYLGAADVCTKCSRQRKEHPVWVGPDGTNYLWEVRDGDLRILKQNQIRGHGMILQAATTILFLHRSRPRENPAVTRNGRRGLMDTRARLILDKTRTGSSLVYVPLAFDLTEDGYRARFYDRAAERSVLNGRLQVDAVYARSGDPMLPTREVGSPFAGFHY
jgi:hypothetical protein